MDQVKWFYPIYAVILDGKSERNKLHVPSGHKLFIWKHILTADKFDIKRVLKQN